MTFLFKKHNTINNVRAKRALLGVFLLLMLSFYFIPVAKAYNIVILTSKDAAPYNSFIKEFKITLPDSSVKVLNMDGDVEKGRALIDKAVETDVEIVVALGARAAWAVKDRVTPPVLFSMVSNPKKYNISGRTGISSAFSFAQQLQAFKEIIPNVKRIGLLYNKKNRSELDKLESYAKEIGIEIIKKEVNDVREVASTVDALLMQVDALWLRNDKLITGNARLVKQVILLRALRKKIPIIADNKWAVQNGALFCLFASYQSIGAQAGRMVRGVVLEEGLGFQYPSTVNVFLNPHVAERLAPGVEVSVPRNAFFVK